MMLVALGTLASAGCAASDTGTRKPSPFADSRASSASRSFHVAPLVVTGVREGQLASREPSRLADDNADNRALQSRLTRVFTGELSRRVNVGDGPGGLTIVPTLTLDNGGAFEGLAAETADAVLQVQLVDAAGNTIDDVTLRASADAPLGRQASRDDRLERAVARLAADYAARLNAQP